MRSLGLTVVISLLGALVGALQAGLLARSARGGPSPASVLFRLVLVAGFLLLAARSGRLLLGTAGWMSGLVAACLLLYGRLPHRRLP